MNGVFVRRINWSMLVDYFFYFVFCLTPKIKSLTNKVIKKWKSRTSQQDRKYQWFVLIDSQVLKHLPNNLFPSTIRRALPIFVLFTLIHFYFLLLAWNKSSGRLIGSFDIAPYLFDFKQWCKTTWITQLYYFRYYYQ